MYKLSDETVTKILEILQTHSYHQVNGLIEIIQQGFVEEKQIKDSKTKGKQQ